MFLKIPKMGERINFDLEDKLQVSKAIMNKLDDYVSEYVRNDHWIVGDVDDNEGDTGIEQKFVRCPYCETEVEGWGIDDLTKNIRRHKKNCKLNPTNKSKVKEFIDSYKLTLPIWML